MTEKAEKPAEFGYFPHDADTGIIGRGRTVEAAFERAAHAMYEIMVDTAEVRQTATVTVTFEEPDTELALVRWLNGLLGEARAEGLILGRFDVKREGDKWSGEGRGEPWSDSLVRRVEVKGATLTALSVQESVEGYEARCVVDV